MISRPWKNRLLGETRNIVIWGTGNKAGVISDILDVQNSNTYNVRFYVDSNKQGIYRKLRIVSPESIDNWKSIFCIIGLNNGRGEVEEYLQKRGLCEGEDYIHWQEIDRKVILGISALYHDSAAALIINDDIIAAAQEERFTRKKHDPGFPRNAIMYCMREANLTFSDLDAVVYYDNPLLTTDRVIQNIQVVKENEKNLSDKYLKMLFTDKLWIHKKIQLVSNGRIPAQKIYVNEHHISHAASAFYASPFLEAAVITLDGVGEWGTTTIGYGKNNELKLIKQIDYPHSLGLLYSAFTYFCGFKVNSGEYKLMGLSPYGIPIYYERIRQELIKIYDDGSYKLNLKYFDFYLGGNMTNNLFEKLFDGPARSPETNITRREANLAASIQKITEEIIIKTAKYARSLTGANYLCLAGGIALNCVANGKLLKEKIFDDIWIQPAAGDAGGAIGAAYYLYYHSWGRMRNYHPEDRMCGAYLGPEYSDAEITCFLMNHGYVFDSYVGKDGFYDKVAELLADGKVIGLFQGRMEFGPRALGNRSIIADARNEEMQTKLNLKIKYRESFRPFAPSVIEDKCEEYFDLHVASPYMLLVADVQESLRENAYSVYDEQEGNKIDLLEIVRKKRSSIPAVTHIDYSARVQTVNEKQNKDYYRILKAFERKTGCGCIVNTSFNVRGEPIVCSPEDAYKCFMRTDMDVLVLNKCILYKEEQENFIEDDDWRDKYELD